MSDVVEGGRPPRGRRQIWWVVLAVGCAIAAVLAALHLGGSKGHREVASPTAPPVSLSPTPQRSVLIQPSSTTSAPPWPSAPAACGGSVYLPQLAAIAGPAGFDGAMLVGGPGLQELTASGTTSRLVPVPGLPSPGPQAMMVTQLVAGPDAAYMQVAKCGSSAFTGADYRISDGVAARLPIDGELTLVGGIHHAWGLAYASPAASPGSGGPADGTVMTALDGGPTITLPPYTDLVADTTAGLVVDHYNPTAPDTPPVLEVLDPTTGVLRYPLVNGYPRGGDAELVVVENRDCAIVAAPAVLCSLVEVDAATGRTQRTVTLPTGRLPVSDLTFSADGTKAAFLLSRAHQDPRFATGHPIGPEDVAVLDEATGRLSIVPGVELAPKTQAGLAFDPQNRLLIAVSQGSHGDLLEWQLGAPGTEPVTTLPGPLVDAPSLLPVVAGNQPKAQAPS